MKLRILFALMIVCLLLVPAVLAEDTASIVDSGLELMDNSVRYPQITGMADEALQLQINDQIVAAGNIEDRISRLALLMQSPVGLQVTYDYTLEGNVFSCALSSLGAVENDRATHIWNTVTIDLTDGNPITMDDLFVDAEALRRDLEEYLDYGVGPELSAHLFNSQLTPVPETFTISPTGLTLYYPIEQLSTLSDRAGAITILWYELRDHLHLEDGSILERIGAKAMIEAGSTSAADIRAAVESGTLPGLPVTLGGSVQEATDSFRMLTDPDLYQDGRMFALEAPAFRQVWLLTDALTEKTWDKSIIKGLRLDRVNLFGLYTGMSRADAQAVLGQPAASVTLDVQAADAYRLTAGISDYYNYTGAQLRLHYNEEDVLSSMIITQTN